MSMMPSRCVPFGPLRHQPQQILLAARQPAGVVRHEAGEDVFAQNGVHGEARIEFRSFGVLRQSGQCREEDQHPFSNHSLQDTPGLPGATPFDGEIPFGVQ